MHFWPYTIQMITDTDTDGRTDAGYFPRARSHPFSAMISYLRKLIVLFFQRRFLFCSSRKQFSLQKQQQGRRLDSEDKLILTYYYRSLGYPIR